MLSGFEGMPEFRFILCPQLPTRKVGIAILVQVRGFSFDGSTIPGYWVWLHRA